MLLKVIADGPCSYIRVGFNVFDGFIVILRWLINYSPLKCKMLFCNVSCPVNTVVAYRCIFCTRLCLTYLWCFEFSLCRNLIYRRVFSILLQFSWIDARRHWWPISSADISPAANIEISSISARSALPARRHAENYGQRSDVLRSSSAIHLHFQVWSNMLV